MWRNTIMEQKQNIMTFRELIKALCSGNHIAIGIEELVDKIDND